jgi:hypothetical protein
MANRVKLHKSCAALAQVEFCRHWTILSAPFEASFARVLEPAGLSVDRDKKN